MTWATATRAASSVSSRARPGSSPRRSTVGGSTRARSHASSSSSRGCSMPAAPTMMMTRMRVRVAKLDRRRGRSGSNPSPLTPRAVPRRASASRRGMSSAGSPARSAGRSSSTSGGSTVNVVRHGRGRCLRPAAFAAGLLALALLALPATTAAAQDQSYMSAMELEQAGRAREAAAAYRKAIGSHGASALLGLERVYAELGLSDSLLPVLDSVIAADPREALYRSILLRTHRFAGRSDAMRSAFERWTREAPGDAAPYREYSRLLLQDGRAAEADTVLQRAQRALGSTRDLETEMAQLRAATGQWELSTQSWRAAVRGAPYLEQAAVFALSPAPAATRVAVRRVLNAPPAEVSARRLLAALELGWGSSRDAWQALRTLPPDSLSAAAWRDFGERAENSGAWLTARDAFAAVHSWRPSATAAVRAGHAALNGNNPESALEFATAAEALEDSTQAAQSSVPLRVRALTLLARPREAEAAVAAYGQWLPADVRISLLRAVALGWVRAGDVTKARTALAS